MANQVSGFATLGAETFFVAPHEETPGFLPINGKLLATNGSAGNWREIPGMFGALAPCGLFGAAGNAVIYPCRGTPNTWGGFSGGLVMVDPITRVTTQYETESPADVKLQGQMLYYSMRPAFGAPRLAARDANDQWLKKSPCDLRDLLFKFIAVFRFRMRSLLYADQLIHRSHVERSIGCRHGGTDG